MVSAIDVLALAAGRGATRSAHMAHDVGVADPWRGAGTESALRARSRRWKRAAMARGVRSGKEKQPWVFNFLYGNGLTTITVVDR